MSEFKDRLAEAMSIRNISAAELSRISGVNEGAISQYRAGKYKASQRSLDKLARALNVSIPWLMGADVPMNEKFPSERTAETKPHLPSNAIPIDFSHLKRIPILGRIAAGVPIYAEENIEGYTVTELNGGAEYFGLRVHGDSMNAARIFDNDIVIIRRQDIVENGQIAAVLVDNQDATLKRFSRHGDIVTLMPQSTNPANQPFIYNLKETSVKILGLVVQVQFRPL